MENIWIGYVVAGVMFLIGFLVVLFDRKKRGRCTVNATATIVDVERQVDTDDDGNKSYSYRPVLEFNASGVMIRRIGNISSGRKRAYKIGDTKQVRYNPNKPEEFIVAGSSGGTGAGILLMLIAVVIVVAMIVAVK